MHTRLPTLILSPFPFLEYRVRAILHTHRGMEFDRRLLPGLALGHQSGDLRQVLQRVGGRLRGIARIVGILGIVGLVAALHAASVAHMTSAHSAASSLPNREIDVFICMAPTLAPHPDFQSFPSKGLWANGRMGVAMTV